MPLLNIDPDCTDPLLSKENSGQTLVMSTFARATDLIVLCNCFEIDPSHANSS